MGRGKGGACRLESYPESGDDDLTKMLQVNKAQSNERFIGEGMDAESETSSFHLPQRGNAYQPRASLWEPRPRE